MLKREDAFALALRQMTNDQYQDFLKWAAEDLQQRPLPYPSSLVGAPLEVTDKPAIGHLLPRYGHRSTGRGD